MIRKSAFLFILAKPFSCLLVRMQNDIVFIHIWGHAVALSVEALRYKPESRGFDFRWCNWNFSLTSVRPHFGPGIESASKKVEYQEHFLGGKGGRCLGMTTFPHSCVSCLEIWEPQLPGTIRACPDLYRDCFIQLYIYIYIYIYNSSDFENTRNGCVLNRQKVILGF